MNFLLGILQYIFAEKVKFDQAIWGKKSKHDRRSRKWYATFLVK
jgi:hypothetical protein